MNVFKPIPRVLGLWHSGIRPRPPSSAPPRGILTGAVTAVGSHRYGALIAEEVRRTATGLDLRNMDPASPTGRGPAYP